LKQKIYAVHIPAVYLGKGITKMKEIQESHYLLQFF